MKELNLWYFFDYVLLLIQVSYQYHLLRDRWKNFACQGFDTKYKNLQTPSPVFNKHSDIVEIYSSIGQTNKLVRVYSMSNNSEVYSETYQTSKMERFAKNS